ncbi:POU domain class 6 transcription factor 2 [Sarcoptes scabiei]|nr:POU domain class 6 transcription factor 2 [Sarcoptes scabiei]
MMRRKTVPIEMFEENDHCDYRRICFANQMLSINLKLHQYPVGFVFRLRYSHNQLGWWRKRNLKKKRDTKEMSWFTRIFYSLFDAILFQSVCNQIVGCFLQVFKVVFFSTKFIQLRNQIDFVLKPVD